MKPVYHYATVLKAIEQLREKGFTEDFNLHENCLVCNTDKFEVEEFEISHIYYYEGDSNPGDEATVYGIESKSGIKGILVTGDEQDTDPMSKSIIDKLLVSRNKRD
ncbi:hypothetical protein GN157_09355 [Flavobacterium rakeshii]|uniref:Phosphoribosylpyrophosphate synthetase n=1 Tax=Flavobacterium rakeshii TaxID=1038845 RepID=A0A6N8HCG0_9FLAO|nr:hypothetical protein [Flavobacterium rakeshii]MUV03912.1 hypothetical protein [Flavobacterium rakeshii]